MTTLSDRPPVPVLETAGGTPVIDIIDYRHTGRDRRALIAYGHPAVGVFTGWYPLHDLLVVAS